MEWKRHGKDSALREEIAKADNAAPEAVRGLMTALDTHAVVTWKDERRAWHLWYRDDRTAEWVKVGRYDSATAAREAAETKESERLAVADVRAMPADTKIFISATWRDPYHGSAPIKVPCSSTKTGEEVATILKRLGMETKISVDTSL